MANQELFEAIKLNNVAAVRRLLSSGGEMNINAKERTQGRTSLHVSVALGHKDILKLLLDARANVNVRDKNNVSPLYTAVEKNSPEIIKFLIDAGAKLNLPCTKERKTVLHWAVEKNNPNLVQYLLARGASVNLRYNGKFTPLHTAVFTSIMADMFCVCEILLKNGADVNARDEHGRTPLNLMSFSRNIRVLKLLLKYKSDVNSQTYDGWSPLYRPIEGESFEIIKFLVDNGADPNKIIVAQDFAGGTHFHLACYYANNKIIKYLLKHNADINAVDSRGFIPLIHTMNSAVSQNINKESAVENLKFLLQYCDVGKINFINNVILDFDMDRYLATVILEHLAKLSVLLQIPIDQAVNSIFGSINSQYLNYLNHCKAELKTAKDTKILDSWLTYSNLLSDNKIKLQKYVKNNESLMTDYIKKDCKKKFPIYGTAMVENAARAVKRNNLIGKSTKSLSKHLPLFNSTPLIFSDILDCIWSSKDLSKINQK